MDRRKFLLLLGTVPFFYKQVLKAENLNPFKGDSETLELFQSIIKKSESVDWNMFSLGELISKIGLSLLGKPYVAFTLEGEPEVCRVNLAQLDCVTFFENSLNLARIIKKNTTTFEDFVKAVTFTRYRGGVLTDYTSRLHYTADWIHDNVQKKVVQDMSKNLGGDVFKPEVGFMSSNIKYYKALKNHPEYVEKIMAIEADINSRTYYMIPKEKIASIESELKDGDIIAIATNKKGLDYSHTGLVRKKKHNAHFLHASSAKKKVVLDVRLSEYLEKGISSNIGISVLRPL